MNKTKKLNFWVSDNEKKLIEERTLYNNFSSVSEFLRVMALKGSLTIGNKNGK